MRLPFISRFAYDEMKSELVARALRAEAEQSRLLDKILRLTCGSDGEEKSEEPEVEVEPEPELSDMKQAIRASRGRPGKVRRFLENMNARRHVQSRQTPSQRAAVSSMSAAFEEGQQAVSK